MPEMKQEKHTVEEVKKEILDTSILVATTIGTLAYLVSLFRWVEYGFHISFIINFVVIGSMILISIIRSRLSINFKTFVVISLVILLSLADAINYGLLSTARIYLILIPFISILYFPFRRTIVLYTADHPVFFGHWFPASSKNTVTAR